MHHTVRRKRLVTPVNLRIGWKGSEQGALTIALLSAMNANCQALAVSTITKVVQPRTEEWRSVRPSEVARYPCSLRVPWWVAEAKDGLLTRLREGDVVI
jgi:hypothetical protein